MQRDPLAERSTCIPDQNWEYNAILIKAEDTVHPANHYYDRLNIEAGKGWELVTAFTVPHLNGDLHVVHIFKRRYGLGDPT